MTALFCGGMLLVPLRSGPAHVVQFGPIRVEDLLHQLPPMPRHDIANVRPGPDGECP
jgi:hypothetical protein